MGNLQDSYTWVGAGAKIGSMLGAAGLETFEGVAGRLDTWKDSCHEVNVAAVRLGLGLGASLGASIFLGFNIANLWTVNNMVIQDWGFNIAFPEVKANVRDAGSALNLARYVSGAGRSFLKKEFYRGMTPSEIGKLRDLASSIWNTRAKMTQAPVMLVIDVPGVGGGAELSGYWTTGEFTVGGQISA